MRLFLLLSSVAFLYGSVSSLPEQGIWHVDVTQTNHIAFFTKTMFVNSSVYLKIVCDSPNPNLRVIVSWVLRYSPCADEFAGLTPNMAFGYLADPSLDFFRRRYKKSEYKKYQSPKSYLCSKENPIILEDSLESQKIHQYLFPPTESTNKTKTLKSNNTTAKTAKLAKGTKAKDQKKKDKTKARQKRAVSGKEAPAPARVTERPKGDKDELAMYKTATTWADGAYLLVLNIQMERQKTEAEKKSKFDAQVTVWMKSSYGYLSAIEWPFLIFYGVMCLVYLAYAIAWTILSACHWRDILRVQFWIGAVILLGMLEKAMFYAEYQSINSTGQSVRGAVIFAEFISCIKRTLARLLLMVVSIGYGIVKPRLGPALIKVVVIGIAYFIFALIEGCIRVLWSRFDMPRIILLVQVPLALTDAIILWWTFTYLVQTIQQMRLRRNIVKFNLYKHFSNILILVVGVSIVFMGWSVFYQKWFRCKRHWREIWVDDAFWHILFSVILLVIIWLWRPSKNNQRYAYSPVLDADDDADEDILMDNLVSGELTKKLIHSENGTTKRDSNKPEDDLRWVEEHIPKSTAAENVFPLVDSDEEIATTKLHLSKME